MDIVLLAAARTRCSVRHGQRCRQVGYHQGNADFSQVQDRRQLPDFTPAFVSNLSDDAIVLLGEMVKPSLGVGDEADAAVLGQQWVDDVTATCSRLKLATTRTDSVRRMTDCV